MRTVGCALLLCFASATAAQDAPLIPVNFEWPSSEPGTIRDLRVDDDVRDAREAARAARTRATEGRRASAQAKRRAGIQGVFGIKPQRATIDDDTQIAATRGTFDGAKLGAITYSTGAVMTGAFGPDVGVYNAAHESPLRQFSGWVWGAGSGTPRPTDGIFEWKNGDTFTGSLTGGGAESRGIYVAASGEQSFIGVVDLSETEFRPVRGYVQDSSGKLLAVVRN